MIWLWPPTVAITSGNVIRIAETAERAAEKRKDPSCKVKLFTAVPYVQKLLVETEEGMNFLRGMDIVGVGGAALPEEVGDKMVQKGINLVSRFGSSECGCNILPRFPISPESILISSSLDELPPELQHR